MFDFRKVRTVANYLAQQECEEYFRSAISRYYYSVFCCVRLYLIYVMGETNFINPNNVHRKICDRLIESNDPTEHSLGKTLDKLRQLRNMSDYDWNSNGSLFFQNKLNFVKNESNLAHEQIKALRNSPPHVL